MTTDGNNKNFQVKSALVAMITIKSAPNDKTKSTIQLVTLENVNIYLGTYVFFKRAPLLTTEDMACRVEVERKSKSIFPVNRYTGKLSIFRLNMVENTTVITNMTKRGFNILHR